MSKLEALLPNSAVKGILPDSLVTVVTIQWFGTTAVELTYKTTAGKVANELLYRHDEPRIEVVELGRTVELRWRWGVVSARFGSPPDPSCTIL